MPGELRGQISLMLTSPPYGRTMHSRVEHRRGRLTRFHNAYSHSKPGVIDPKAANLAHRGRASLIDGITAVLAGCVPLLRPDGLTIVVARPWRRDHFLVDLPSQTIQAGLAAGLRLVACRRAVHAAARNGRLVPHHTFWQLSVARASRLKGMPVSLFRHDDIAVFQAGPPAERSHPYPEQPSARGPDVPVTTAPSGPENADQTAEGQFDGESRYHPAPPDPHGPAPATVHQCPTHHEHESRNDDQTRRPRHPAAPR